MTPRERFAHRLSVSTDGQIASAVTLLVMAILIVDVALVAGAAWLSLYVVDRTQGAVTILTICLSLLPMLVALIIAWRMLRGYRNLRRLIDEARNGRNHR